MIEVDCACMYIGMPSSCQCSSYKLFMTMVMMMSHFEGSSGVCVVAGVGSGLKRGKKYTLCCGRCWQWILTERKTTHSAVAGVGCGPHSANCDVRAGPGGVHQQAVRPGHCCPRSSAHAHPSPHPPLPLCPAIQLRHEVRPCVSSESKNECTSSRFFSQILHQVF